MAPEDIYRQGGRGHHSGLRARQQGVDRLLDVENIIDHPYVLEVSSPGLTRALKKKADFERYAGRRCRIVTRSAIAGRNEFTGEIAGVGENEVELREEGETHAIPLDVIKKAHLELEL